MDNNKELQLTLASETGQVRPSKKPRILDETIVDQDDVDHLSAIAKGDHRGALGVVDGMEIEIKWKYEYDDDRDDTFEWCKAVVVKAETGRDHRFIDEIDAGEFVDVPIVSIKYDENEEPGDFCFISPHEVFAEPFDCIMLWRVQGDTWDDNTGDGDNDIGVSLDLQAPIEDQVDLIVSKMFVDILETYKSRFDSFSTNAQVDFGREVLRFKESLVKKLSEWIENKKTSSTDSNLVLGDLEIEDIIKAAMDDMDT